MARGEAMILACAANPSAGAGAGEAGISSGGASTWRLLLGRFLSYHRAVIVTCPNCGARYRLGEAAAAAVMAGKRMKCAECSHRWQPDAGPPPPPAEAIDEDEELAAVEAESRALRQPGVAAPTSAFAAAVGPAAVVPPVAVAVPELAPALSAPEPAPDALDGPSDDDSDAELPPRGRPILKTLVALVLGGAFGVAAAGLWFGELDPARLPVIGERLGLAAPPPLSVTLVAQVTVLASGERVLDVTGTIANPGPERVKVPPIRASLSNGGVVVRRWTIAPPADSLGPGGSAGFSSTLTDVPAGTGTVRLGSR